ncbi:MAG: PASTA domain-containing protein [Ginsengibacter sp.]
MFKFIARQPFFINLLFAILLIALVGFLFFQSLGWLTHHGKHLKVPSVTGLKVEDAYKLLEKEGFEVVITDSAYTEGLPMHTVKKQLPDAEATVKVNRTVFLNINPATLPLVSMPKLEGLSYRFAINKLEKDNLLLGDTTMRADFMKGSVLEQLYNGKRIESGTKLRWGSKIDLVIGAGLQEIWIKVPDLIGSTVDEARRILEEKGIILAAILTAGNITDTAGAFVYKQNPEVLNPDNTPGYIQPGQTMDIWIQIERPVIDTILHENFYQPDGSQPKNEY